MQYEWDRAKAETNLAKHSVAFEAVEGFEWDDALVFASLGRGEPRLGALGVIGDRLHFLVYSIETRCVRVISLRKANRKEVGFYEQKD
ncbi:MAG: BrnT family toxin [Janthinobacterium lividum]